MRSDSEEDKAEREMDRERGGGSIGVSLAEAKHFPRLKLTLKLKAMLKQDKN